jgi:hypothetical protein
MALKTFELVNILLSALVTGVFWGPWVGLTRSIATFSPAAFLAIGYRLNVNLAPLMTALMPIALLSAVPTLILSPAIPAVVLTLAGVVLFLVALVVTLAVEVPIAVRVKSWTESTLPEDWQRQRDRWASVHIVRVVTGVAGLGSLVAAAIYG